MDQLPSLHEMLTETINSYLAQTGGGIPNGFIYAVNYIDSDGDTNNEIGCMEDQSPVLSAGLNSYLSAVTEAWVQRALFGHECEDCDDGSCG